MPLNQHGLIGSFKPLFISGELEEFTVSNQDGFPIFTDGGPFFEASTLSIAEKQRLVPKINELLASGYLERSHSEWSSPVRPKVINGKLDICVDYRSLNSITDDYEDIVLPTIPDVLDSISQSDVFSKVCLATNHGVVQMKFGSKFWFQMIFGDLKFRI